MMKSITPYVFLLLLFFCFSGCSTLQTEFFREETRYIYNSGCRQYRQGNYDTARELFKKVLDVDPDYGPAHGALGNLALLGASYESALAHYREAIRADPELEVALRPFILAASVQSARRPLREANIDLRQVYLLMMGDKQAELEVLLSNDVPLDLLANDTLSITASELGELRLKAAAGADPGKGSARYRLFTAYFLFYGRTDSELAAALIEQAAPYAKIEDRKDAYVFLGKIRERLGDFNLAVDAYLMAVNAGQPLADVAPHLARIYNVDMESILSENKKRDLGPSPPGPPRIELSLPVPKPALQAVSFERVAPEIEQKGLKIHGQTAMF